MILVGSFTLKYVLWLGYLIQPGMTGPESVVLPLHHSPIEHRISVSGAKIQKVFHKPKHFRYFFH